MGREEGRELICLDPMGRRGSGEGTPVCNPYWEGRELPCIDPMGRWGGHSRMQSLWGGGRRGNFHV